MSRPSEDGAERLASQAQLDRIFDRLVEVEPRNPSRLVDAILGRAVQPDNLTAAEASELLSVLYMEYDPE